MGCMANNKSTFQGVLRDARLNASIVAHIEHRTPGERQRRASNVERQRQRQRTERPSTIDTKTPPVCETLDEEEEAAAAK